MKKNTPDTRWLLGILSYVSDEHIVFVKGYRPPPRHKQKEIEQLPMMQGLEGFFENLPELSLKEQKKAGGMSFLSKRQRIELQLARMDEREQKLKETREKKMADLLLLANEDSEEEGL